MNTLPTHTLDIEALLALHRAIFGDARMEDDTPPADTEPAPDAEPTEGDEPDPDGADALGDAGKKALEAMKAERKAERQRRRAAEERVAQLEAELNKLKSGNTDDSQPDLEAIRAEAEKAATAKANERIVKAEIKAAAAGRLADPEDAVLFLDASEFEVGPDGNVDVAEIREAIEDLIAKKPHLAAQGGSRGSGDGGVRNGRPAAQLTRDDLQRMTPEEIAKARAEGRLNKLLGVTA